MSQYHDKSFRLMGATACEDQATQPEIDQFELHFGIRLPASVREWFSLRGSRELVEGIGRGDRLITLEKADHRGLIRQGLLPIREENQGVCLWALKLNGSDDPPVLVEVDGEGTWIDACVTFSDFIWTWVWDHQHVQGSDLLIMANELPISSHALQVLNDRLTREVTTWGFPGHTQYRFSRHDLSMFLWLSEDQTDWFCAPATMRDLNSVVDLLNDAGISADGLYAHNPHVEHWLRSRRVDENERDADNA